MINFPDRIKKFFEACGDDIGLPDNWEKLSKASFKKKSEVNFLDGWEKSYFIYCYWDNGCDGGFVTDEEAKEIILDCHNRDYDEAFDYILWDVDSCKEIKVNVNIEISVGFSKE